jgi:hypothetical protein
LIHRSRALSNDLNTSVGLRLSVVLTAALTASLALAVLKAWAGIVAAVLLAALIGLNFPYYQWFGRRRGSLFALRVIPVHLVHHLCNGLSFIAGTLLHVAGRFGVTLPGALPAKVWAPHPIPAQAQPRTRSCT